MKLYEEMIEVLKFNLIVGMNDSIILFSFFPDRFFLEDPSMPQKKIYKY